MTRETLLALAERIEAATGPDRVIDRDITHVMWELWNGNDPHDWSGKRPPAFSASIDAAMTLVPENGFPLLNKVKADEWHAHIGTGSKRINSSSKGKAGALALTAAALRARAMEVEP